MTATRTITLRCDAQGCTAEVVTSQARVCDARAEAAGAGGWSCVDEPRAMRQGPLRQCDYCPSHRGGMP